jgi:argininosuccinate lyase
VVRRALELNAAAAIFAHNHPSGVSEPSQADLRITQRLKEALGRLKSEEARQLESVADYLVRKGVPFRDAHEAVGKAVALGVAKGCDLAQLSLPELQSFSEVIGEDVYDVLTLEGSLAARDHVGGTAPRQVRDAIARARARLAD